MSPSALLSYSKFFERERQQTTDTDAKTVNMVAVVVVRGKRYPGLAHASVHLIT